MMARLVALFHSVPFFYSAYLCAISSGSLWRVLMDSALGMGPAKITANYDEEAKEHYSSTSSSS